MSDKTSKLMAEVKALAQQSADRISEQFEVSVRPRLARMLIESAAVAVRAAAGEDVTTATLALEASVTSIAREQKAVVVLEGRTLALQAAVSLILRAALV